MKTQIKHHQQVLVQKTKIIYLLFIIEVFINIVLTYINYLQNKLI